MFMLQLMDSYSATYNVLVIALVECLALSYVYGEEKIHVVFLNEIYIYYTFICFKIEMKSDVLTRYQVCNFTTAV